MRSQACARIVAADFSRGRKDPANCLNAIRHRLNACMAMAADGSTTYWSIYLLRCADGSLYTGIATDVERRLQEHRCGKRGSKYLRGRGPLRLEFSQTVGDRSLASRVEHRIKQLSRQDKEALIRQPRSLEGLLQSV